MEKKNPTIGAILGFFILGLPYSGGWKKGLIAFVVLCIVSSAIASLGMPILCIIPNLVGGPTSELLGDKIAQRVFVDRNLPHASALSALLMLGVFLPFLLGYAVQKIRKCFVHKENNAESLQGEAAK